MSSFVVVPYISPFKLVFGLRDYPVSLFGKYGTQRHSSGTMLTLRTCIRYTYLDYSTEWTFNALARPFLRFRVWFTAFVQSQLQRDVEMRLQLGIRDKEGMTVAMHAARTRNIAIFALVVQEIEQTGVCMIGVYSCASCTFLTH